MICKKCGYENLDGVKKCGKCGNSFIRNTKGCPKCATKNDINAHKCKKCGTSFSKKKYELLINLFISLLVVLILGLLVFFGKENWVNKIELVLQVLAIVLIVILILKNFYVGKGNVENMIAENKIVDNQLGVLKTKSKIFTIVSIIILLLGIMGIGIYYLVK